jgi:hypothetical protein
MGPSQQEPLGCGLIDGKAKKIQNTAFFYSASGSKTEIAVTNVRALESLRKCKAVKLSF